LNRVFALLTGHAEAIRGVSRANTTLTLLNEKEKGASAKAQSNAAPRYDESAWISIPPSCSWMELTNEIYAVSHWKKRPPGSGQGSA